MRVELRHLQIVAIGSDHEPEFLQLKNCLPQPVSARLLGNPGPEERGQPRAAHTLPALENQVQGCSEHYLLGGSQSSHTGIDFCGSERVEYDHFGSFRLLEGCWGASESRQNAYERGN
jgi:hypothetical protein